MYMGINGNKAGQKYAGNTSAIHLFFSHALNEFCCLSQSVVRLSVCVVLEEKDPTRIYLAAPFKHTERAQ